MLLGKQGTDNNQNSPDKEPKSLPTTHSPQSPRRKKDKGGVEARETVGWFFY